MKKMLLLVIVLVTISCKDNEKFRRPIKQVTVEDKMSFVEKKVNTYISFKLTSDVSVLSESEKKMLALLLKAANIMNELFWYEAYGNNKDLLDSIQDEFAKKFNCDTVEKLKEQISKNIENSKFLRILNKIYHRKMKTMIR